MGGERDEIGFSTRVILCQHPALRIRSWPAPHQRTRTRSQTAVVRAVAAIWSVRSGTDLGEVILGRLAGSVGDSRRQNPDDLPTHHLGWICGGGPICSIGGWPVGGLWMYHGDACESSLGTSS